VFSVQDGKAATLGVVPLGDGYNSSDLARTGKVLLDLVESGPGDPSCCPTTCRAKAVGWKDGRLQLLASDAVGGLSINLLAATDWMLVEMDGQPLTAGLVPPTTLVQYGKAAGFSGCNRYTGPITESAPGNVKIGELAVTRKACDARCERDRSSLPRPDARNNLVRIPGGAGCCWSLPQDVGVAAHLALSRAERPQLAGTTRSAGCGRIFLQRTEA